MRRRLGLVFAFESCVYAIDSTSYSAAALLARHRLLDFARIVYVVRDGHRVRRHISSKSLTDAERAGFATLL